jgi:urease accessory protein
MTNKFFRRLYPFLYVAASPLAQAHPGHGPADFAAGFIHPLTGWDHMLAMVAVGLWAALLGGKARWALPSSFVGAMTLGAAIGIAGFRLPSVDTWILATVLVMGLLVAAAIRLPLSVGTAATGLAGFFHGLAHGMEMPFRADSLHFLAGMIIATGLLHATGVTLGVLSLRRSPALLRLSGLGIIAGGIALLVG